MTEGPREKRGRGSSLDEAQVRAAFAPYLEFRAAQEQAWVTWTETFSDRTFFDLWARQKEMEAALIAALAKLWQEWTGTSPRTVGTGASRASKLELGEFPFRDWIVDRFNAVGETPPSTYAIRKAIKGMR